MMYLPVRLFICPVLYCNKKCLTSDLKIFEVELREILSFTKAKVDHKVLRFGFKSS